jgi:SAM-dependent methyltransferase
MNPSTIASTQYLTSTSKLTARIAIYAFNKNPQNWFTWLGDHIPLTGSILEVGAGTGELWKHVDHSSARLTLTDFSPAMCAQLRSLALPNATVEECNAEALSYADNTFDSAIADHMIYHIDNPDAVLAELSRVLKPGGHIAMSLGENGLNDKSNALGAISTALGRPPLVMKHSKVNVGNAQEWLEKYFAGVEKHVYSIDLEVPNSEPVLNYLDTIGGEAMSVELREKARQLVEERKGEDGIFRVSSKGVLFTARTN